MTVNNLANRITIFRLILVPIFLILAYTNHHYLAFAAFVIASISDFLDGYVARHYNQISTFGQFMDPLADKVLAVAAMCYFVQIQRMGGWVVALVCFREFSVSGLRLIAAQKGSVISAGISGKVKTAASMIGLSAMFLFKIRWFDLTVSLIILVTTLYSGIDYFIRNKEVFEP